MLQLPVLDPHSAHQLFKKEDQNPLEVIHAKLNKQVEKTMSQTLIDTFLYNEPGELELLIAKLATEDCDELIYWIIVENQYSFQGINKGHTFLEICRKESRLDLYKKKIIYVPVCIPPSGAADFSLGHIGSSSKPGTYVNELTKRAFAVEHKQRMSAFESISKLAQDNTSVIVSDIDEMVDLSDAYKKDFLFCFLRQNHGRCMIQRYKYQYDIDNAWPTSHQRWLNIINAEYIKTDSTTLAKARSLLLPICRYPFSELAYEYSYVFSKETIYRKLNSFSHVDNYNKFHVDRALLLNTKIYTKIPNNPILFEKVKLSLSNSPMYVLDNIGLLSTGIVSRYYKAAREITRFTDIQKV